MFNLLLESAKLNIILVSVTVQVLTVTVRYTCIYIYGDNDNTNPVEDVLLSAERGVSVADDDDNSDGFAVPVSGLLLTGTLSLLAVLATLPGLSTTELPLYI